MSIFHYHYLHLLLLALLLILSLYPSPSLSQNDTAPCPLNFTLLTQFATTTNRPDFDVSNECQYILQGLRLVQSHYLQLTNSFVPPFNSSESCWSSYQSYLSQSLPNFNILTSCGFQSIWISLGCMNITTRSDFEKIVPKSALNDVVASCNQSLENSSPCASCLTSLSSLQASYLTGPSVGNVSVCTAYPSIYAAAFSNRFGPLDQGTAQCLFSLGFTSIKSSTSKRRKVVVVLAVLIGCAVGLAVVIGSCWFSRRRLEKSKKIKNRKEIFTVNLSSGLSSINENTSLTRFSFDDIKQATGNFSRDLIIGTGGYGNVYRGTLQDGSEIAVKRFKNCSPAGDVSFAHEVEVIASVRHVNLVALRGYCITATARDSSHQRMIVCDLMKNGSLYDHLFGSQKKKNKKLSWPIRQRITLGMARGLAYLHSGAEPAIIHRDIKASNILLDEKFDARLADFGLAKFNREGRTHMSTRVAGTLGYVAPEYALYGQLSDRSDVYSFGVVLLELLSGKKALNSNFGGKQEEEEQPCLVTEWAWELVREGRCLEVVEEGMEGVGEVEVMERFVLVAVLCSHPQLYARPTMDQVLKMLESDCSVPLIPDRPVSLVAKYR